jgi:hypothetical protein
MAAVEVAVDSTGVAASTAVARFAVAAVEVEDTAAATSAARELMVEAPTEAARPWAGALDLADPADSGAGSTLQVADMQAAADTVLTMRSRTATGILLAALEAPWVQEVQQDFATPQLAMAVGTHLEARTRV